MPNRARLSLVSVLSSTDGALRGSTVPNLVPRPCALPATAMLHQRPGALLHGAPAPADPAAQLQRQHLHSKGGAATFATCASERRCHPFPVLTVILPHSKRIVAPDRQRCCILHILLPPFASCPAQFQGQRPIPKATPPHSGGGVAPYLSIQHTSPQSTIWSVSRDAEHKDPTSSSVAPNHTLGGKPIP